MFILLTDIQCTQLPVGSTRLSTYVHNYTLYIITGQYYIFMQLAIGGYGVFVKRLCPPI